MFNLEESLKAVLDSFRLVASQPEGLRPAVKTLILEVSNLLGGVVDAFDTEDREKELKQLKVSLTNIVDGWLDSIEDRPYALAIFSAMFPVVLHSVLKEASERLPLETYRDQYIIPELDKVIVTLHEVRGRLSPDALPLK